jgi:hypothetical protein
MKRIILAAIATACLTTAVQAQQTLEQAENSDACRIARGERPLGYRSSLSPSHAQIQSACDIFKREAIRNEQAKAAAEEQRKRQAAAKEEQIRAEAKEAADRQAERERIEIAETARRVEEAVQRKEAAEREAASRQPDRENGLAEGSKRLVHI